MRTPSFTRFLRLFWKSDGKSILRALEYERLSTLKLSGRVLDFGGGARTNYSDIVECWSNPGSEFVYESANIDLNTNPTYLVEPGGSFPVGADRFDAVIALNTFEHVYDLLLTFSEIHRVLKPSGRLVFIVPFIFRVHGHPDDYMRGTPSFWEKFLNQSGFSKVEIEALNWGPFSTALTVSGCPGPLKRLRRDLALLLDIVYFAKKCGQDTVRKVWQDSPICNAPLGYFVQAVNV